jgi:Ala-tRNA(Pro) deacylase
MVVAADLEQGGLDRQEDSFMALSHTLETFLEDHHALYELEHHALALSSLCTARVAHIDEHCLAKSVLLEDDDGPVLAVLPAARRLELASLREQLGRNLRFAPEAPIWCRLRSADRVRPQPRVTGRDLLRGR